MSKKEVTAAVVDKILLLSVTSSALAAGILIPNLLVGLEKPLNVFWKHMDKRARERELRRVVSYMKTNHLLKGDYKHGLKVTDKGLKRLEKAKIYNLRVRSVDKWDGRWRLVIYDIPESHKQGRNALTGKLNRLGFYQLQRSAWLHPFPCRTVITELTAYYKVNSHVSYLLVSKIDNQAKLIKEFKMKYRNSNF